MSDIEQIKSDMLSIIMTRPGERVMEPKFGCPLDTLNITQPTELLIEQARHMIAAALKMWEKRVQVTDVQVVFNSRQDSKYTFDINIEVTFIDPVYLQQEHVLTLQTPVEVRYGRKLSV